MKKVNDLNLTGKQKAFLKKEAHSLHPIIQIGKNGVEDTTLPQIEEALERRELIKINLLQNTSLTVSDVAEHIEESTDVTVVQKIGKTLVLYKPSTQEKYQDISLDLPR